MNKILCNSVEYAFLSEIDSFDENGTPVLKSDGNWKKIDHLLERSTYSSDISQSDAGTTNAETVSARARYNEDELLLSLNHLYIVLRLKTDAETFYIGTYEYPVQTQLNHNKVEINFSFSRNSEG